MKFESAGHWIYYHIDSMNDVNSLKELAMQLATILSYDDIQNEFTDEMSDDGFYAEEITVERILEEHDWLLDYKAEELDPKEVLCQGQADDLKEEDDLEIDGETIEYRVWLGRVEPNMITIELRVNDVWESHTYYDPDYEPED